MQQPDSSVALCGGRRAGNDNINWAPRRSGFMIVRDVICGRVGQMKNRLRREMGISRPVKTQIWDALDMEFVGVNCGTADLEQDRYLVANSNGKGPHRRKSTPNPWVDMAAATSHIRLV